jgi:ribosomal protein S12 methylthiotransferase
VDTEVMIAKLSSAGWQLESEAGRADTVIINTCAFIDPAKEESTEVILEHASRKRRGQQLIVAGCLAQRYGAQLQSLVPEIDGVVGTGAYAGIVELLEDVEAGRKPVRLHLEAEPEHDFLPRLVTTPRATAYLKIAEGCDHPCTFCIIPALRGKFRSRSMESILLEAEALVNGGAKELILIAQDTSMWGRDRGQRRGGLAQLLERLHAIDGLQWIRLLYLYPAHPEVLRAMRRPGNGERYLEILDDFRSRIPGITMRSTFIVGFPGETDEHVEYLERWIERAQLDRVGFFEYSAEEGTPAAELSARIGIARRRRRLIRLREAQRVASERARAARCGTTVRVLAEEFLNAKRAWFGRSEGEAPGVDGGIYFTGNAQVGEFLDVRLEEHGPFDFFGHAVSPEPCAI